jgi:hypothetical protein
VRSRNRPNRSRAVPAATWSSRNQAEAVAVALEALPPLLFTLEEAATTCFGPRPR